MVLLVAAMYWALRPTTGALCGSAYIAFASGGLLALLRMLGTLLNTSLFFLIAALIVSALAWVAYLLHHRQAPATGAAA